MASLQMTFKDLREEVQRYLGYGRTTNFLSMPDHQQGDIISIINRGFRQFYNPMPLPGESSGHDWSFLRGEGVIQTTVPVTAGTVTASAGSTNVTGSGTAFTAAMVGRIFKSGGQIREIATQGTSTSITLDVKLGAAIPASSAYEIVAHEYELPSDFGGLRGEVTFRDDDGYAPLRLVNEASIMRLRTEGDYTKDVPEYVAIIPADTDNESTSEQRFKLSLWPFPDKTYDLLFSYTVYAKAMSSAGYSVLDDLHVPIGGAYHSETILSSCLAVAEQIVDEFNNPGKMQAKFVERLSASISYDRRNMLPDGFGYNGDHSNSISPTASRRRLQNVTRNNILYP